MPALPPYITELIWKQFVALLPPRKADFDPLDCYRRRFVDVLVFDKLVQVFVFGRAHAWITDKSWSASTLRRQRNEWISSGTMEKLREMALEA